MELKLTSFNIRFANPADGKHDWPHRRDLLSEIIKEFNCDILGTQEGREPQLRNLADLINEYQLIDEHRDWIEERMYPCIFIKPDIIDVKESGDFWLSETPDVAGSKSFESAFPRLCTWMKAQHKNTGSDFLFVNTHLDHVKQSTRVEQARVLSEEIQKINKEQLPMILMGDFNDCPTSPVREVFNQHLNLNDPWLEKNIPEESTHHSFNGEVGEGVRIDWTLLSDQFDCEDIFLDKREREGVYPSDHFPLLSKIKLP